MDKTVEQRVIDLVIGEMGVNPETVTREAKFEYDLFMDSFDFVELVMAAEEEFDINIPYADASVLLTVGDAIDYIEQQVTRDKNG